MSGLDTSQAITDEVSLHAAEHHAHSLPREKSKQAAGEKPSAPSAPDADAEQKQS
jgi:hypothetical protein